MKTIFIPAFVLCLLTTSLSAEPTTRPVDDAIAHLSDPDPAIREQAAKLLRAAGADARGALQAAAKGDDPELATRAREILSSVTLTTKPTDLEDDDDGQTPSITRYRASAPAAKRLVITQLTQQPGGAGALVKLWQTETDLELRGVIFDELVQRPTIAASILSATGNTASAELLLQAAVDRKIPESLQSYAVFYLIRGKLDEAIRRWVSRGGQTPPNPWAEQVLAVLHRAKGDAPRALRYAEAADDREFLHEMRCWAGDWGHLTAELHENGRPEGVGELAMLTGLDAIIGSAREVDADVAKLRNTAKGEPEIRAAVDAMLLASRPDEAVTFLKEAHDFAGAFEILAARGQFDDAMALLDSRAKDAGEDAILLRCAAAKVLGRLGDKAKATELIASAVEQNAQARLPQILTAVAEAERATGMTEAAWDHFGQAIDIAEGQGWGRANAYVSRAFPSRDDDIGWTRLWFAVLSHDLRQNHRRPARDVFNQLRHIYDHSISTDDLVKLIDEVDLADAMYEPYLDLVWEACRRRMDDGKEQVAIKLAERSAMLARSGELYIHLGDLASGKNDWTTAADYYQKAWRKDRSQALPLYLQGLAWIQAGRKDEGRERVELAHMLPLGDESQREQLLRALSTRDLHDAVSREAAILLRTAKATEQPSDVALRVTADHADEHGDFQLASACWHRSMVNFLGGKYLFRDQPMYLYLSQSARRSQARALLAGGNWEGALKEIKICQDLVPNDIQLPIDVVNDLEKVNRRSEADELFKSSFATQEALCSRFPNSANEQNQIAWLAAKCHRELDKALVHASKAVELAPRNTAYIDTLAETYFVRGEFDSAIVEMKKCVTLEPQVRRNLKQIQRFEAAKSAAEKKAP